uniref:Uncharacterized protein n=1 Tax=Peronospora matthiolae TaxID=2874970 RepID=A0AAV1UUY4_9STRA
MANSLDQSPDKKVKVLGVLGNSLVVSFVACVDLAALPVVKTLLLSDPVFDLLDIVSTKTFRQFAPSWICAKSVLLDNGLEEANVAVILRLFTLCTLSTGFQANPYAGVAMALDMGEEAVDQMGGACHYGGARECED